MLGQFRDRSEVQSRAVRTDQRCSVGQFRTDQRCSVGQ